MIRHAHDHTAARRRSTIRLQALRPVVEITPRLAHTYIPMVEPDDLSKVTVEIRRLGETCEHEDVTPRNVRHHAHRHEPLLTYPAHDWKNGHIGFRWDTALHALPFGRYEATILVGCEVVHRYEMFVSSAPPVGSTAQNKTVDDVFGP